MAKVARGERPFAVLDVLHRENLVELLAELEIGGLSEAEIDQLNLRLASARSLAGRAGGHGAAEAPLHPRQPLQRQRRADGRHGRRAGLPWDVILGAEVARAYKPSPEAYDSAARMLALRPAECLMVAAHPTDLAAAATRGFRTAYVAPPARTRPWPRGQAAGGRHVRLRGRGPDRLGGGARGLVFPPRQIHARLSRTPAAAETAGGGAYMRMRAQGTALRGGRRANP